MPHHAPVNRQAMSLGPSPRCDHPVNTGAAEKASAAMVSGSAIVDDRDSRNGSLSEKFTDPVYDVTFTTGANEDICLWSMFLFRTDIRTYACALRTDADGVPCNDPHTRQEKRCPIPGNTAFPGAFLSVYETAGAMAEAAFQRRSMEETKGSAMLSCSQCMLCTGNPNVAWNGRQ